MEPVKQRKNKVDAIAPYMWKKGQSGNPKGRPKGKTMKEYAREMLECMTDKERADFLHGIDKKVIWEMSEGKPRQDTDITSGGEKITPLLVKFLDNDKPSDGNTEGVQETL